MPDMTVFIDGEAGTTGLGIRERLADVPGVALRSIDPQHRKDLAARRDMMAAVDLVVLCLPDGAAKESVAMAASLGADTPKLLDASTAHRCDPAWAYGFPELAPDQPAASPRRRTSLTPAATRPAALPCCARWWTPGCWTPRILCRSTPSAAIPAAASP